jgi:hypothetical protein
MILGLAILIFRHCGLLLVHSPSWTIDCGSGLRRRIDGRLDLLRTHYDETISKTAFDAGKFPERCH